MTPGPHCADTGVCGRTTHFYCECPAGWQLQEQGVPARLPTPADLAASTLPKLLLDFHQTLILRRNEYDEHLYPETHGTLDDVIRDLEAVLSLLCPVFDRHIRQREINALHFNAECYDQRAAAARQEHPGIPELETLYHDTARHFRDCAAEKVRELDSAAVDRHIAEAQE